MLLRCLFGLWVLVSLSRPAVAATPEQIVIQPVEETNAVLRNPDMGWVLYENYPLDTMPGGSSTLVTLPNETFPEVDAVALMFTWQDVEHAEGVYDFSKVDFAYDYWRKRGKSIQLRLSSASLMFWENRNPPAGKGIPEYVRARMAPDETQVRKMDGIPYQVEDARNAFYQERLEKFLREVGKHFGKERPVTLIDLRGFGAWGEWHSGFPYHSMEARREGLKAVLDVWSRALPEHYLALSYSYDPDGPKALYGGSTKTFEAAYTTNYTEFLKYSAFDYALTKTNVTFRRDGCGGAVHSNERKLCEEAFSSLSRGPFVCEFLGGYGAVKKAGTNWVNWMIEDALSLHPNYINLLGWQSKDALHFTQERPDLVRRGLLRMGYRLVPVKIAYPAAVARGRSLAVQMDWVNRGVGRAVRPLKLQFQLRTESGNVLPGNQSSALNASQWMEGKTNSISLQGAFPMAASGKYALEFTLQTSTGEFIALPLGARNADGSYQVGGIEVR